MKRVKRILALSLSAALLLALLAGCNNSGAQTSVDPSGDPGSSQGTESTPTPETPVDLSTFVGKLGEAYDLPMLESMPEEFISDRFPGLTDLELSQCYYYAPMMSGVSTAEFVLIEVGDAADMDAVKDALQARIDEQNSPDAMLYPHEQEDWANNARIESNGSYVLMVVNENCDAVVGEFNALFE